MIYRYKTFIRLNLTSQNGDMFYANVFALMEEAAESFLMDLNYSMRDLLYNKDFSYRVVHSEASYHHPLLAADKIVVEVFLSYLGRSSFHLSYRIINTSGQLCVEAKTVQVRIRLDTMKSAPLNSDFKSDLQNYLHT